jgi:segregation and condensation protein A
LVHLIEFLRARFIRPEEVPVGALALSFRSYVKSEQTLDVNDVAEFAVLTSQLALLKSRTLLPVLEWEEEDLASSFGADVDRDATIEPYLPAIDLLSARLDRSCETFSRLEHTLPPQREVTAMPIPVQRLSVAFKNQVQEAINRHVARVTPPSFIRVEVAARSLRLSLKRVAMVSLIRLIRETRLDRRAIVVYFLAVLEVARDGYIGVHQEGPFKDIVLEKRDRPHADQAPQSKLIEA